MELIVRPDELASVACDMFGQMGDAFGASFDILANHGLLDLLPRPGKAPGGSCSPFPDQRVSFIFANLTGTPRDVTMLVHEAGHALQKWRSRDIDLAALRQPSKEVAEVHSTTLELLVHPWVEQFFGTTADTYRTQHVRSQLLAVPYMAAVDEFQHHLYDTGRETSVGAPERAQLWGGLMSVYQPGIDWPASSWYHENHWLLQHHITTKPFYYLDYALAQVVAWQLWLESLEDRGAATDRYLSLCDLGGSMPFRSLLHRCGIRDPFDPGVIADVARRLQSQLLRARP